MRIELSKQGIDALQNAGHAAVVRAGAALGAVGGESRQCSLKGHGLAVGKSHGIEAGIDDSVKDYPSHARGVLLDVARAQVGAVRRAKPVKDVVAERGTDDVHVLHGVVGTDVACQPRGE